MRTGIARGNYAGRGGELGVSAEKVTLILADTGQTPNDGSTAGSGTTRGLCRRFDKRLRRRADF